MQTRSLPRRPAVDEVAASLRNLIARSGLGPGDRLESEHALAEKFSVSRNVIREAIGRLAALGLIEVRRGRGMFVGNRDSIALCAQLARTAVTIDARDWRAIAELRIAIECQAARRAAERASAEQLGALDEAVERMGERGLSFDQATEADWEFHRRVISIGGGAVMLSVIAVVQEFLLDKIRLNTPRPVDRERQVRLHRRIVAAIRSGDSDEAERVMRRHVEVFAERIERFSADKNEGEPQ